MLSSLFRLANYTNASTMSSEVGEQDDVIHCCQFSHQIIPPASCDLASF